MEGCNLHISACKAYILFLAFSFRFDLVDIKDRRVGSRKENM